MKKFLTMLLAASILISGCSDSIIQNKSAVEKKLVENFTALAATTDIDWDTAPRFNNQRDLANYLNECRKNLVTSIPVVVTGGFKPATDDLVKIVPVLTLRYTTYGNTGRILYEITNYPGERVAYAYLHGDNSFLTAEEMELYKIAVHLVNEAKYNSVNNPLYEELAIHDAITGRVTYFNEEPQPELARFKTAIGALIDGQANCQGYSDAFYMLGNMCGFNVEKILGYANNEHHSWNMINFGDGKNYFVDVTFDDASFKFDNVGEYNNYVYFNAPTEIIGATHNWLNEYEPNNLQRKPDSRYFYYAKEYDKSNGKHFGTHAASAEKALEKIAYHTVKQGWRISYVSAPYDAKYADPNIAVHYLTDKILPKYGWRGTVTLNVMICGGYMFFTADAVAN